MLFLDEPTTGLDPQSRATLWRLVREEVARGVAVLLTTQYLEEADRLADQIVVIDSGRVIAEGAPEELKRKAGAQYLEISLAVPAQVAAAAAALAPVSVAEPTVDAHRASVGIQIDDAMADVAAAAAALRVRGSTSLISRCAGRRSTTWSASQVRVHPGARHRPRARRRPADERERAAARTGRPGPSSSPAARRERRRAPSDRAFLRPARPRRGRTARRAPRRCRRPTSGPAQQRALPWRGGRVGCGQVCLVQQSGSSAAGAAEALQRREPSAAAAMAPNIISGTRRDEGVEVRGACRLHAGSSWIARPVRVGAGPAPPS